MEHRRTIAVIPAAAVLAIALLALLASPSSAQQSSAEDQYVDSGPTGNGLNDTAGDDPGQGSVGGLGTGAPPTPGVGGAPGNPADPDLPVNAEVRNASGDGEAGGGLLPFTDYPTTPLIDFALLLIAAAVAIRIGLRIAASRPKGAANG